MKLSLSKIILLAVAGLFVFLSLVVLGQYNRLVSLDVQVDQAWANIQVQYQRRADLIPQLVATVQGSADFEQETLQALTEARSAWVDAVKNGSAADQQEAGANLDGALARFMVNVEAYPTLQATKGFQTLQIQVEGTENRIGVARIDYNKSVTDYNQGVRRFPMMLVAGLFGFERLELFEASEGSEVAPTIKFE